MHDGQELVLKDIEYVPGLYKIFDEILVNAADNKVRDPKMDKMEVTIDPVSTPLHPNPAYTRPNGVGAHESYHVLTQS